MGFVSGRLETWMEGHLILFQKVKLSFSPREVFSSYNWIQTVTDWRNGKYTYINWEDGYGIKPFYYTPFGAFYMAETYSSTSHLQDLPGSNLRIRSFYAESTLVGVRKNGTIVPLGSFTWSFTQQRQYVFFNPFGIHFSLTPSVIQQSIIDWYNVLLNVTPWPK